MNFVGIVLTRCRQNINRVNKIFNNTFGPFKKVPLLNNTMPENLLAIEERHKKAVELVSFLRNEIDVIERVVYEKTIAEEHKRLLEENKRLKSELESLQAKVIELETKQGIKQITIPKKSKSENNINPFDVAVTDDKPVPLPIDEPKVKTEKKEKKEGSAKKKEKTKVAENDKDESKDIHVGRLDLRVGRIVSVDKHPDADSLYVEQIDLGEERPRTIISGLVKYVPIEQMQNRLVIVLCNLKPAKMRGLVSEGMVMCASTPEKVEILRPPSNAVPGETVTCDNFPSMPDSVLNPKKKIFEQVSPDLKTNNECIATYKSFDLKVGSKGVIKADSLIGVQIK